MAHSIFFSWQVDTPSVGAINFIERALTAAANKLIKDLTVEESIRVEGLIVDRDTKLLLANLKTNEALFLRRCL